MSRQSELTFSDFIVKDRFELNSYLAYLFHQVKGDAEDQSEHKMLKHIK
ncbi:hypothetical protein ACEWK1_27570 [Metabacillus sp. YM-086]